MPTLIRPMVAADRPGISRILRLIPEFKPEEVIVAEELIDAYLEDPVGSGYPIAVSETDGSVAGYVCYGPTPLTQGTWDIYWIAVDPGLQGLGLGGSLLAYAEEKMREAGGRLVLIETASKSEYQKTRRFYDSQCYRLVCRIADFYEPGDDRLTLEKRLV